MSGLCTIEGFFVVVRRLEWLCVKLRGCVWFKGWVCLCVVVNGCVVVWGCVLACSFVWLCVFLYGSV